MPEISVVVPVYKVEPYLKRCVDSILNQKYTDFQLILVDDGSPDNCGQICDEYAEKDSRIHVIHRENGGLSAARNSGINWVFEHSLTEWITFIDSDDWVTPNYLEVLLDMVLKYDVNISVGHSQFAYNNNVVVEEIEPSIQILDPEDFWVQNQGHATVAWLKLYKTSLFEDIRYPEGKLHEDEFTTYRLLFSQERIAFSSERIYFYYQSPNSIMRSKWTPKKLDGLEALEMQMQFFRKHHFMRAYHQAEGQYAYVVKVMKKEIMDTKNHKANYRLLYSHISEYLAKKNDCRLLSLPIFSLMYLAKTRIKVFFITRFKVAKIHFQNLGRQ